MPQTATPEGNLPEVRKPGTGFSIREERARPKTLTEGNVITILRENEPENILQENGVSGYPDDKEKSKASIALPTLGILSFSLSLIFAQPLTASVLERIVAFAEKEGATIQIATEPALTNVSAKSDASPPPRGEITVPLLKDGMTPALWANRRLELEEGERPPSPADFIRKHYGRWEGGTWEPMGLTRAHLAQLDPPLYHAYAQWIRRSSNSPIAALASQPRVKIDDPVSAIEKRRQRDRERKFLQRQP